MSLVELTDKIIINKTNKKKLLKYSIISMIGGICFSILIYILIFKNAKKV